MVSIFNSKTKQKGFTIVELMIATAIFTVILLLATFALIQIGKIYSKGVNSAATQSTARSIIDEVSQAIQFSGGNISAPVNNGSGVFYFAAGSKCYSYVPYKQLEDNIKNADQANHAFVRQDGVTCDVAHATPWTPPAAPFTELLGPHMRVVKFYICEPGEPAPCAVPTPADSNLYSVGIRIIYGDNDLICSPSISATDVGGCKSNTPIDDVTLAAHTDWICKSGAGSQFCAVSEIATTVQKRL